MHEMSVQILHTSVYAHFLNICDLCIIQIYAMFPYSMKLKGTMRTVDSPSIAMEEWMLSILFNYLLGRHVPPVIFL